MTDSRERFEAVRGRMARAAAACGRRPEEIHLVAVSKRHRPAAIRELYALGHRSFGENYVSEAQEKIAALAGLDIQWHYIGPLQSNKTRPVAEQFHWVHSVDREKILRRLSAQRPPSLPPLHCCLQVHLGEEASKSGAAAEQIPALATLAAELPGIRLRGLMGIPPPSDDPTVQRRYFAQLRRLLERLNHAGLKLDTLSMGMSGDLEAAIAEGSTMVRVGTALFGPREPSTAAGT